MAVMLSFRYSEKFKRIKNKAGSAWLCSRSDAFGKTHKVMRASVNKVYLQLNCRGTGRQAARDEGRWGLCGGGGLQGV